MPRSARTIWKGSLSFGLVNVPVGLYPATEDKSVHFNQFEEGTSDRIRYRKVNERTGAEVQQARIIRGVDVGSGNYVVLRDDELEALAPERSRTIEISEFVDLADIDPLYFRSTYYLAPDGQAGAKAYALLRRAMRDSGKVGIATLVMRAKEYLVAVRAEHDVLVLQTMYFADEVRPVADLPDLPAEQELSDREVQTANLLIDAMATEWDPERHHDTYRQQVRALVDQKLAGEEIVTEAEPLVRSAPVIDLMEALNESVREITGGRVKPDRGGAARGARAPRKPATKKSAGKAPAAKKAAAGRPVRSTRKRAAS
jgi:DNA end-binding protein Ku